MLDIPMHTLKVALRDNADTESNCWMAEDAFGYIPASSVPRPAGEATSDPALRKNILILDDINDTGATLEWIKQDWQKTCLPNETEKWNTVWGETVRVAVIVNNESSEFKNISYAGKYINKLENPEWIVFPWESWWSKLT
jgi:hypoxanthine phosphoribosyltransferase